MRGQTWLAVALLGAACGDFNPLDGIIGDLANPLVTQSMVLGTVPPASGDIEIPAEYREGTTATVFLADAKEVTDLDNAPIADASVVIEGTAVPALGDGTYILEPGNLSYADNAEWNIVIDINGEAATGTFELPPAVPSQVPSNHQANTKLTLDFAGYGYDSVLVVVIDQNGDLVYDNRPNDIKELYEFTRGGPIELFDIEAEAFPAGGAYLVGIAGMTRSGGKEALEDMNTALSSLLAGKMTFSPIAVTP